jgi:chemotaxis protein methyltransferase CheR
MNNLEIKMTLNEYHAIQHFLRVSCGIELGENKQYLVKNRLTGLLNKFDMASFSVLANTLQTNSPVSSKLKIAVVDAMTTNETFWFRDDIQFLELKEKIFPEISEKKTGTIKVWSSACSSGQEPYTMSMCVEEAAKQSGKSWKVQILGTDISETILIQAKAAIYSEIALSRGLEKQTKNIFFHKISEGYKLNTEITAKVRFQQFNLLNSFSALGKFDVIFCRNVLIYFSDEVKRDILSRMVCSLEPHGYIFLSSTESMPTSIQKLELVRAGKVRYFKKNC